MLHISAKLLQSPVLLSPTCASISDTAMIPLVGHVIVENSRCRYIGGIRILWESRVQRMRRRRNGRHVWDEGYAFERIGVDVMGPVYLGTGKSVFEFVVQVPVVLASSRTTHFDKISHTLHAALIDIAPAYDRPSESRNHSALTDILHGMTRNRRPKCTVFGLTPLLATSSTPIHVFSLCHSKESTAYDWRYHTDISGLGSLSVGLISPQFSLGRTADLHFDLSALSPSTTIHSITASLVQTTTQATLPMKYSRANAVSCRDDGSPEILKDKYELYTFGTSWARMPGRLRPDRGSYIWRGREAAQYTTDFDGREDIVVHRASTEGFGMTTTLVLPSPIIGAHPTTSTSDSAFSSIDHHLEIRFEYSVLGQDVHGNPLSGDGWESMEGSVRTWTLEKEVQIHSDLSHATSTAAPPYSPKADCPAVLSAPKLDMDLELDSIKARRSISLGWTSATLMRPVAVNQVELDRDTRWHWEKTSGLCACFEKSSSSDDDRLEEVAKA